MKTKPSFFGNYYLSWMIHWVKSIASRATSMRAKLVSAQVTVQQQKDMYACINFQDHHRVILASSQPLVPINGPGFRVFKQPANLIILNQILAFGPSTRTTKETSSGMCMASEIGRLVRRYEPSLGLNLTRKCCDEINTWYDFDRVFMGIYSPKPDPMCKFKNLICACSLSLHWIAYI